MNIVKSIEIKKIKANPYQPRSNFDSLTIEQLAASIKEVGLLQPISLRESKDGYELIAGERRLRATKLLGLDKIDAIVIKADEVKSAQLALLENVQRENLSAIEEANGYLQILRMNNLTQEQLADKLGKSQSSIANKIRLLNLNLDVQQAICEKKITERHGRALLQLQDGLQVEMLNKIIDKNMNVQQTEDYINAHYINTKNKTVIKSKGANEKLVMASLKQAYDDMKKLGLPITYVTKETEKEIVFTFTLKK